MWLTGLLVEVLYYCMWELNVWESNSTSVSNSTCLDIITPLIKNGLQTQKLLWLNYIIIRKEKKKKKKKKEMGGGSIDHSGISISLPLCNLFASLKARLHPHVRSISPVIFFNFFWYELWSSNTFELLFSFLYKYLYAEYINFFILNIS